MIDHVEIIGDIHDGRLTTESRVRLIAAVRGFADGTVVIHVGMLKKQRSAALNRFWHSVVVTLFADHCGYSQAEAKDALALHLIPREIADIATGEVRTVPGHTSKLTNAEFLDMMLRAQVLGSEMGIVIPNPNEYLPVEVTA